MVGVRMVNAQEIGPLEVFLARGSGHEERNLGVRAILAELHPADLAGHVNGSARFQNQRTGGRSALRKREMEIADFQMLKGRQRRGLNGKEGIKLRVGVLYAVMQLDLD